MVAVQILGTATTSTAVAAAVAAASHACAAGLRTPAGFAQPRHRHLSWHGSPTWKHSQ